MPGGQLSGPVGLDRYDVRWMSYVPHRTDNNRAPKQNDMLL
jgi:hypothetical protein